MSENDELLTTEEVAEILKVQPRTVLRYISQLKLPAIDLEGSYRVFRKDLNEFLLQRYTRPQNLEKKE